MQKTQWGSCSSAFLPAMRWAAFVLLTGFSGCATIVNGRYQAINVTSEPSDAVCVLDEQWRFTTPSIIPIQRAKVHDITCQKDALAGKARLVGRTNRELVIGNLFVGLIPGIIVDDLTGADQEFERSIKIELEEKTSKE